MTMKKILILASVVLMATACSKKEKAFDATGTFEATEVTVSAKATGELKTFDVTEGLTVEQGTLLGRIDTYQLVLKKQQFERSHMDYLCREEISIASQQSWFC